jgi:hypothetical protein
VPHPHSHRPARPFVVAVAAVIAVTALASSAAAVPSPGGSGWIDVPHGHPDDEHSWLDDMAATGDVTWAVGYREIDVAGTKEFRNWAVRCEEEHCDRTSPRDLEAPPFTDNHLWGVAGTSPSDVWAVGVAREPSGDDTAMTHHFDGSRWTIVPNPLDDGALKAVSAVATDDAWALGYVTLDRPIVILRWDGVSWTDFPFKIAGACRPAEGWDIAADGRFPLIVGTCETRRREKPLVASYRHGEWQREAVDGLRPGFALHAVSWVGRQAWISGSTVDPDRGGGVPITARWRPHGGWERIDPGFDGGGVFNAIDGSTRRNVWAVGDDSCCFVPIAARWNGRAWTPSDLGTTLVLMNGLGVTASGVPWAAGARHSDGFLSTVMRYADPPGPGGAVPQ